MEQLFNEDVMLKLISMLEGATVWGAIAVITYFLIPVLVAFVQFGFGVWATKYIAEAIRDLFIGVSGGKGVIQRVNKINLGRQVITDCEGSLYSVLVTAHGHANNCPDRRTYRSKYWHEKHINWLQEAINDKAEKESQLKAVK